MKVAFIENKTIILNDVLPYEQAQAIKEYPTGNIAILSHNHAFTELADGKKRLSVPQELEPLQTSPNESIQPAIDFIHSFYESEEKHFFSTRKLCAYYGEEVIQVFEADSLSELIILDFLHCFVEGNEKTKKLCICPCCGRLFRKNRANKIYCCWTCTTKAMHSRNMKSPYFAAYRNAIQYIRFQINSTKHLPCSDLRKEALEKAYKKWHYFAKIELDELRKSTHDKTFSPEEYENIRQEFKTVLYKAWDEAVNIHWTE